MNSLEFFSSGFPNLEIHRVLKHALEWVNNWNSPRAAFAAVKCIKYTFWYFSFLFYDTYDTSFIDLNTI